MTALVAVVSRKGRTEDRARAYLAGFTYVLSDDPDAAIVELSRAAQLSRETLETYLALGALFRRKGDLERAIRLHQNILLRPGLSPEVRPRAELALAIDYRRAGLRDKAAECFERILAADPDSREALLRYRQLLEETGDWERAATLQERLTRMEGGGQTIWAHLLANHARALSDALEEAERVARRAIELAPESADAQLALGQALVARGNRSEATAALKIAVSLEPELAPRVLLAFRTVMRAEEVEAFLERETEQRGEAGSPFALALALWRKQRGEVDAAIDQLRRLVERRPWLWEARRELGALLLAQDRSDELRADYQEILGRLGDPAMGFVCSHCGHRLPEFRFRCAICETWDAIAREDPRTMNPPASPENGGSGTRPRPVI